MAITYHGGVKDTAEGYKLLGCKYFITHFDTCLDKVELSVWLAAESI